MDINDYNSKLTAHRQQFRDATKNLRENHEKEVSRIEETNETQRAKQQETYLKNKAELEKKVQTLGDNYNDRTREEISRRQNDYRERLMGQREDFEREMNETKSDFRRRLSDLSTDYQRNIKSRENLYDEYSTAADKRYKKSLDNVLTRHQNEVDNHSKITSKSQQESRDRALAERRDLMKSHEGERQNLVQQLVMQENEAKERQTSEVENMRRVKDQEIAGRDAHHKSLMETQRFQNEMQDRNMRTAFSEMNDRLDRNARAEIARVNEQGKNVTQKQAENFADDRLGLERKIASLEDDTSYLSRTNTEDRIKKANETRVKNIFAKMDEQQKLNTIKEKDLEEGFKSELDSQAMRSRKTINEKDQEINRLNVNVIGEMRQNHMEDSELYQKTQRETQARAENDVLMARKGSKREADKLHLRYGQQITALQENNSQVIESMRNEQAREQTEFLKGVQRQVRDERLDMQDNFNNKFEVKVDQLESKIAKLENERKLLVEKYEQRIGQMKDQEMQNAEQQRVITEDRRAEDQRNFQRTFVNQQREFDQQLKLIKRDVEQQIAKIKRYNDTQLTTMTRDYETRLVRERQEHDKEMKMRLSESEANFMRLESLHNSQVNAMREQYEDKMNKLREAVNNAEGKQEIRSGYMDA